MRKGSGLFITVEGGEGAGKTTVIRGIAQRLQKRGRKVVVTREPGATALGQKLRALILDPALRTDTTTEALMFAADRSDHIKSVVLPALAAGAAVISDRYTDSTRVYQSGSDTASWELEALIRIATGGLNPSRTYLLDVPPEVGLARASARGELTSFDARELAFHQRVRERFLALARQSGGRIQIVDAQLPPESVLRIITEDLDRLLRQK